MVRIAPGESARPLCGERRPQHPSPQKITPAASAESAIGVWTEWAAKRGVSETIAAALYLLSENRKAEAVVGKLNPSELEQVIDVIGQQRDRFPPALKESRPTPPEVNTFVPQRCEALAKPNVFRRVHAG